MQRILILALFFVLACKREHKPSEWRGVPAGTQLACEWRERIAVCVAGGVAYQCVSAGRSGDLTVIECARVSAAILPEKTEEQ
jgi:hypothetical protein